MCFLFGYFQNFSPLLVFKILINMFLVIDLFGFIVLGICFSICSLYLLPYLERFHYYSFTFFSVTLSLYCPSRILRKWKLDCFLLFHWPIRFCSFLYSIVFLLLGLLYLSAFKFNKSIFCHIHYSVEPIDFFILFF